MGLDDYCRIFIKGFCKLALHLTHLTQKGQAFVWDMLCEKNLRELKKMLTMTLMLILLDSKEPFVVYYDAYKMGLGGMLMHNGKVVSYALRHLNVHVRHYPTHDLELEIVVFMLKLWRHYLYGSRFEEFSDHKRMKYLFHKKELNMS